MQYVRNCKRIVSNKVSDSQLFFPHEAISCYFEGISLNSRDTSLEYVSNYLTDTRWLGINLNPLHLITISANNITAANCAASGEPDTQLNIYNFFDTYFSNEYNNEYQSEKHELKLDKCILTVDFYNSDNRMNYSIYFHHLPNGSSCNVTPGVDSLEPNNKPRNAYSLPIHQNFSKKLSITPGDNDWFCFDNIHPTTNIIISNRAFNGQSKKGNISNLNWIPRLEYFIAPDFSHPIYQEDGVFYYSYRHLGGEVGSKLHEILSEQPNEFDLFIKISATDSNKEEYPLEFTSSNSSGFYQLATFGW